MAPRALFAQVCQIATAFTAIEAAIAIPRPQLLPPLTVGLSSDFAPSPLTMASMDGLGRGGMDIMDPENMAALTESPYLDDQPSSMPPQEDVNEFLRKKRKAREHKACYPCRQRKVKYVGVLERPVGGRSCARAARAKLADTSLDATSHVHARPAASASTLSFVLTTLRQTSASTWGRRTAKRRPSWEGLAS